jgi:hypothetical protein
VKNRSLVLIPKAEVTLEGQHLGTHSFCALVRHFAISTRMLVPARLVGIQQADEHVSLNVALFPGSEGIRAPTSRNNDGIQTRTRP